jgi:hypothetical protein
LIRTTVGDYRPAFLISGSLCLLAAVLSLGIGRERRRSPSGEVPRLAGAQI